MSDTKITFGIPPQRMRVEEKYDFPVLTMEARPEKSGGGYRFNFNKAAQAMLELDPDDRVAFSFPEGQILVANLVKEEHPSSYRVTKSFTFADSKLHNYLNKVLETDGKEIEFSLEPVELDTPYNIARLNMFMMIEPGDAPVGIGHGVNMSEELHIENNEIDPEAEATAKEDMRESEY